MTPKTKITASVLVTIWIVASIAYADVWVEPTSFDVSTPEGTVLGRTLTIGNDGAEVLNFKIRTRQVGTSSREKNDTSMSGQGAVYSSIPAQHDFTQIAPNASYQPGRLIVRFAQGSNGQLFTQERKNQILNSLGGASIKKEFRVVPGLSVVQLPAGMTVENALKTFNKTDGILYAEPDYEVTVDSTIPNDTLFNELWGMHNTGQSGGTIDADIDAPEAWDISTGSKNIIVAVIDTGVDYTHPDLAANMWVNEGEIPGNGQDDDGNGYIDDVYGYDFCNNDGDPWDDHYHGTHCAGTIGAVGNNNQGVAGVCWNVRIMAVKFLNSAGSGSTSDAISSVQYSVLMGANLSSNSWGGGGYSQGLKDAIDAAGAAGMLFVAAAGNDGVNNDTYPHYPSSYDSESLIAVMATNRYDNKSSFSNYGPVSVDLGAPGSEILSCKPGNQYQYLNGTSMATPHVAGACALLWSVNSATGNLEIKNMLLETVDPTLAGQCVSGGRLNLYKAILETKAPWIIIEPEEGTVGPGESVDVSVTFDALELAPGVYKAEIVVISDAPSSPTIIPVMLTVTPDDLQVAPVEDFNSSGTRGGPFTPKCKTYTLTNNGAAPVSWTTSETESWLSVEPSEGTIGPSNSIDVGVCVTSDANLLTPDIYEQILTFENLNSGSIKQRLVTLMVKPPDCFTESFDGSDNDLEGLMLTFSPDGSGSYYEACREKASGFPTDPNGGTYVSLGDDDFAEVILSDDPGILLFYGGRYDRFYIGSNGYITFGSGDAEFSASLENHFSMPRISAVFADLTPLGSHSISYKQLGDRVAVTFNNVPLYGNKTAKNSFQVEMFYVDGTIRITWLKLAPAICVTGLSEGYGLPPLFLESDLSKYLPCWPECDLNRDYYVNFRDFAILAEQWLEEDCTVPFWCGKADMDLSSTVDYGDLSICAINWLTADEWWLRPISHWKFDEGSGTIAYDSVGDNDGILMGDPTWVSGKIGEYALDFDGSGDYVSVGNTVTHNLPEGSFTAWVFPVDLSSVCGEHNFAYIIGADSYAGGGELGFRVNGDGSGWASVQNTIYLGHLMYPPGSITVGSWHLVAMTWDGSYWKLYINGVKKDSKAFSQGTSNATNTALIGKGWDGCTWNGEIDDVRIYDRALSAEEIWQLYWEGLGPKAVNPNPSNGATGVDPNTVLSWSPGKNADSHDVYFGTDFDDVNDADTTSPEYKGNYDVNTFDPCGLGLDTTYYWRIDEVNGPSIYKGDVWSFTTWVAPNLVSWWKFDEGSGNIAHDSVGDNDGTVYGATWTTGQINGALSFDGINDYVALSSFTVSTNSGTIALWFKTSANFSANYGGMGYLISRDSQYYSYLTVAGDGTVPYWIIGETDSQDDYFVGVEGVAPVDAWNQVVVSFNNKTAKTYLNGELIQTEPVTNSSLTLTRIGGRTSEFFNGKIDDVRIYDRALSAGEVWLLYQQGLSEENQYLGE
jgi:subtilisin family serine protease